MIQKKEELSHSMLLCTHRQDFASFKRKVDSGERKKESGYCFCIKRSPHVLPSKSKRHTAVHSDIDCFLCCCSLSLLLSEWVSVSKLLLLLGHLVLPCFSLCLLFLSTSAPVQERRNYVGQTKIKSDFLLLFPQTLAFHMGDITSFRMFEWKINCPVVICCQTNDLNLIE